MMMIGSGIGVWAAQNAKQTDLQNAILCDRRRRHRAKSVVLEQNGRSVIRIEFQSKFGKSIKGQQKILKTQKFRNPSSCRPTGRGWQFTLAFVLLFCLPQCPQSLIRTLFLLRFPNECFKLPRNRHLARELLLGTSLSGITRVELPIQAILSV